MPLLRLPPPLSSPYLMSFDSFALIKYFGERGDSRVKNWFANSSGKWIQNQQWAGRASEITMWVQPAGFNLPRAERAGERAYTGRLALAGFLYPGRAASKSRFFASVILNFRTGTHSTPHGEPGAGGRTRRRKNGGNRGKWYWRNSPLFAFQHLSPVNGSYTSETVSMNGLNTRKDARDETVGSLFPRFPRLPHGSPEESEDTQPLSGNFNPHPPRQQLFDLRGFLRLGSR